MGLMPVIDFVCATQTVVGVDTYAMVEEILFFLNGPRDNSNRTLSVFMKRGT